jgi:hypothetical protein
MVSKKNITGMAMAKIPGSYVAGCCPLCPYAVWERCHSARWFWGFYVPGACGDIAHCATGPGASWFNLGSWAIPHTAPKLENHFFLQILFCSASCPAAIIYIDTRTVVDNEEQKTNTLGTLGNGTGMDEVPCGAA